MLPIHSRYHSSSRKLNPFRDPRFHQNECPKACRWLNDICFLLSELTNGIQEIVNIVDRFIEDCVPEDPLVQILARWLEHTCKKYGIYPRSLCAGGRLVVDTDIPPLQNGVSSDVYCGSHIGEAQVRVAIKRARMYEDNAGAVKKKFIKEAMIMRALCHRNIIPFIGIIEEPRQFCILTKWMQNGNVMNYLTLYPEAPRERLVCEIADGLLYLELSGVVHGDLKGDNILVDEKHSVRIADFGSAHFIASSYCSSPHEQTELAHMAMDHGAWLSASPTGGTHRFIAPELLREPPDGRLSGPTHSSDIFSFAMVIYQIYTQLVPLHHIHLHLAASFKMLQGERPEGPPSNMPGYIWQLVQDCWEQDPSQRPTARDVCDRLFGLRVR